MDEPTLLGQADVSGPRLIVAVDTPDYQAATRLVSQLSPKICRLKIGKELFTACGPRIVEAVQHEGFEVFLDLKFHDIPNTTSKAVAVAADLGVWMLNVHASGGKAMLEAASESLANRGERPLLIAVTVLTSMDEEGLQNIGVQKSVLDQVTFLAKLAKSAGLDGVVSSAWETQKVKAVCGAPFLTVTPGIRPADSAQNDQKRTTTPEQALVNGSDYIVVGRPVTAAQDPHRACEKIVQSLSQAGIEK